MKKQPSISPNNLNSPQQNKLLLRCFRIGMRFGIISLFLPFSANAALSATTAKTIQGTEPRLSSALETEIINQTFSRFGFTYNGTSYTDANIGTFPKLAPGTTTPASIKALITGSTFNTGLSNEDALDTDGDNNFLLKAIDSGGNDVLATNLSIKIRDNANNDITTSTKTFCQLAGTNPPPYKIEISNNLRLTTQYGDPIKKDYTIATSGILKQPSKQYQFALDTGVCEVQPNLQYSFGTNAAWTGTGFKVISPTSSSGNFPTTGFNGAFFNLKIAGVDATTLTFTPSSFKKGNVTVTITTPSSDTINVYLKGPSSGQKAGGEGLVGFIAPGDIEIADDAGKISYQFNITKWFIPRSGGIRYDTNAGAKNYCDSLDGGGKYGVPTRAQYTNNPLVFLSTCPGDGTDQSQGGSACVGGNYTRAIGGGLFAEWGYTFSSYYASSDWDYFYSFYWASEAGSSSNQYTVTSNDGRVAYVALPNTGARAACVSL